MALGCDSGSVSGPDISGHHSLFCPYRRHEILFAQEVEWKLDQEPADFFQFLQSSDRVLFVQAYFGKKLPQLRLVPHEAGRQAAEHLKRTQRG